MCGAIPPLLQYVPMAWYLVKAQRQLYILHSESATPTSLRTVSNNIITMTQNKIFPNDLHRKWS